MQNTFDRIALARKLRDRHVPNGPEYVQAWMSFNTFYNQEADRNERTRAMNSIRHNITDAQSQSLLSQLFDEITFFTQLPPADTRKHPTDPLYRK